ncbi:trans-aconitate 2-methyltransferase [uncultured Jatrophihabitans sp.]|uniref:trans-aconitate 2-methyltransferase n=1 Tax=uncultured Jatrophihabitans sp. TaxID=1610747 RepID=UPI0035C9C32A
MDWNPTQYLRYADERERPFADLLARIDCAAPRAVVDLGCGPGRLTATLAQRWPAARIEGVDSSAAMIESARPLETPNIRFRVADVAEWTPEPDIDVIVSNATLQWVPEHRSLLTRWAAAMPAGGWLAMQVPGNFDAPSHVLMRELAASARWAARLAGVLRHAGAVDSPPGYAQLLAAAGLSVDVWETTYLHVLRGADPVLEWVRGTGLRPVLAALPADEAAQFEQEYAALLRTAYPAEADGTTLFPFRRIFAVGQRR